MDAKVLTLNYRAIRLKLLKINQIDLFLIVIFHFQIQ